MNKDAVMKVESLQVYQGRRLNTDMAMLLTTECHDCFLIMSQQCCLFLQSWTIIGICSGLALSPVKLSNGSWSPDVPSDVFSAALRVCSLMALWKTPKRFTSSEWAV